MRQSCIRGYIAVRQHVALPRRALPQRAEAAVGDLVKDQEGVQRASESLHRGASCVARVPTGTHPYAGETETETAARKKERVRVGMRARGKARGKRRAFRQVSAAGRAAIGRARRGGGSHWPITVRDLSLGGLGVTLTSVSYGASVGAYESGARFLAEEERTTRDRYCRAASLQCEGTHAQAAIRETRRVRVDARDRLRGNGVHAGSFGTHRIVSDMRPVVANKTNDSDHCARTLSFGATAGHDGYPCSLTEARSTR